MSKDILRVLDNRLRGSKILPYVKVKDSDEYFSLPKSERERFGLYRKPFGLPMESTLKSSPNEKGWNSWENQIRKDYPVQWVLREWLFSLDNPVYLLFSLVSWRVEEYKYCIKRFFDPCFPRFRKAAPRHKYSDISELSCKVNLALIRDFWHEEVVDGIVDWKRGTIEHKTFYKELKAAIKYIEVDRPKLQKRSSDELTRACNKTKGTFSEVFKKHDELELKLNNKDTEILVWFMKNRFSFWT